MTDIIEDPTDLISTSQLDNSTLRLAKKIVKEKDVEKVKDLTYLFNLNQNKKNVLRVMKLNSLLDKVSDQMIERLEKRPGEFTNKELVDYMTVTQSAIDRANKSIDMVNQTPQILQIDNRSQTNNLNISIADKFDRESKMRIAEAIKGVLSKVDLNNLEESKEIYEDTEESREPAISVIEDNNSMLSGEEDDE